MKTQPLREGPSPRLSQRASKGELEGEGQVVTSTGQILDALRSVADPCCRERGISVVDMGLLHDVTMDGGHAHVDILLTSGWCPFQVELVAEITDAVEALPDVDGATVRIVLDEAWSTARMSDEALRKLRFLPDPADVDDRDGYVAARALPLAPPTATERPPA